MAVTTASQTPRAEPAPDDILASRTRPVPVVRLARRRPRPPLRPEARPPVPRGGPGPGPADRHQLDPGGQARRPVSVLLPRRRRRRQAGRSHRLAPLRRGGPAPAGRGHAADPRPGRHADEAVRAARPGGRRASQPHPRPGRLVLRLRPRLRRPGAARQAQGLGHDRPAAPVAALHPQEGPAGDRREASAGLPHQAGDGRRAAAVGQAVAGPAQAADLGGGRRRLCHQGGAQAGQGAGDDRRQPAPQGRRVVEPCPSRSRRGDAARRRPTART